MRLVKNEKGIALAMVLVLAAITLAIMAALVYMITTGTQISGMEKRYKTALEAGMGGADMTYQFIAARGDSSTTASLLTTLTSISPQITTSGSCCGTNMAGTSFCGTTGGLAAKLNTSTIKSDGTPNWSSACGGDQMAIVPTTPTTYDMMFSFGGSGNPVYTAYAKIVDTVEGNSGGDAGLLGKGVVSSGSGEISVVSRPYLYTIEVDAETANPSERAKLSVLYQY